MTAIRDKNTMNTLTNKEISKLIKESGFKSKSEFARFLGLNANTVLRWGKDLPVPGYFLPVISLAKKAKKYDELTKK